MQCLDDLRVTMDTLFMLPYNYTESDKGPIAVAAAVAVVQAPR